MGMGLQPDLASPLTDTNLGQVKALCFHFYLEWDYNAPPSRWWRVCIRTNKNMHGEFFIK